MIPDTLSSVSNDEEGRYRQGDSDHDQAADINLYNQLSSIDFVNFVNTTSESVSALFIFWPFRQFHAITIATVPLSVTEIDS